MCMQGQSIPSNAVLGDDEGMWTNLYHTVPNPPGPAEAAHTLPMTLKLDLRFAALLD